MNKRQRKKREKYSQKPLIDLLKFIARLEREVGLKNFYNVMEKMTNEPNASNK